MHKLILILSILGNYGVFHLNLKDQKVSLGNCRSAAAISQHPQGCVGEDLIVISIWVRGIIILGNAPLQSSQGWLECGERQLWSAAPRGFVSEPIVDRTVSLMNDGWVLTLVYDAAHHRSDLVILDARI